MSGRLETVARIACHPAAGRRLVWSPSGRRIAYQCKDRTICAIDALTGSRPRRTEAFSAPRKLAWSPDEKLFATFGVDGLLTILDGQSFAHVATHACSAFEWLEDHSYVVALRDGYYMMNGPDAMSAPLPKIQPGASDIWRLTDDRYAFFFDTRVEFWDYAAGDFHRAADAKRIATARNAAPGAKVLACAYDETRSELFVSTSDDPAIIQVYNAATGTRTSEMQGHIAPIRKLAFIAHLNLLCSLCEKGEVRLWNTRVLAKTDFFTVDPDFALSEDGAMGAALQAGGTEIIVMRLNARAAAKAPKAADEVRYCAARIVLLGDSGVGKTALGWRLAHDEFRSFPSTHGRQFWFAPQLAQTLADGCECEVVIWDLAGQPDYRITHTLYLDNLDVALLLFDATEREDPLKGVKYWLGHLTKAEPRPDLLLSASRIDRGMSAILDTEVTALAASYDLDAGRVVRTSATTGDGVEILREKLKALIDWEQKPRTVTSRRFKALKDHLLKEKSALSEGATITLVRPEDMMANAMPEGAGPVSDNERQAVMRHLESHGFLSLVRDVHDVEWVLSEPELLDNLASSIVLEARKNPEGLGALDEAELLDGQYPLQELSRLDTHDSRILIEAATNRFVRSTVCFRASNGNRTFLVFPSMINQTSAKLDDARFEDGDAFLISGAVERIHPSLVVLLGYTNLLARKTLARNAATYSLSGGEQECGFRIEWRGPTLQLELFFSPDTSATDRQLFGLMVEKIVRRHDVELRAFPRIVCSKCQRLQPKAVIAELVETGAEESFCGGCGAPFRLFEKPSPAIDTKASGQTVLAEHRVAYEQMIGRLLALRVSRGETRPPSCFISYAREEGAGDDWVRRLAQDLRNADVDVRFDRWHSPPGNRVEEFTQLIRSVNKVVVVCSPELCRKYDDGNADYVIQKEIDMTSLRASRPNQYGRCSVIPLVRASIPGKPALPAYLETLAWLDFQNDEHYFVRLFELLWSVHGLPHDHPLLAECCAALAPSAWRA